MSKITRCSNRCFHTINLKTAGFIAGILLLFSKDAVSQWSTIVSDIEYVKDMDWVAPGLDNVVNLTDAETVGGSPFLYTDKQVNNYVRLFIDHSQRDHFTADKSYKIEFQLKYWTHAVPFDPTSPPLTASLTEVTVSPNPQLTVYYDYDNNSNFVDLSEYRFNNAYRIRIAIISVKDASGTTLTNGDLPEGLAFELGIERERYYEFDPDVIADEMDAVWDGTYNQVGVSHFGIDGATHYDIEWTYSNNYSTDDLATALDETECTFEFHNNSSRIQVNSNSAIKIPAVFDRGFVVCRVRGIGMDISDWNDGLDKILVGDWNITDHYDNGDPDPYFIDEIELASGTPYVEIGTLTQPIHEENKNWMYQVSFAEEGKMKHSISYMDATMRTRQNVVLANTSKEVMVSETYYDHQGRAAVQSLAAPPPLIDGTTKNREVKYYELFNLNADEDKFSRLDFDMDEEDPACDPDLNYFDDSDGAGLYYSDQNEFKNSFNAFIPDAEGYPFMLTEFMPDMTGRVRRQTMPGPTHALDMDHVTKYMYGTPFQDELDRLFGTNVGDAAHYQKNAVIDPNGQISVSYIDMKGNVIATALSGTGTSNTDELVDDDTETSLITQEAKTYTIDLLDQDPLNLLGAKNFLSGDTALVFNSPIIVTEESDYLFTYDVTGVDYMEECLGELCLNCVYDLNIQLFDECKSVVGGVNVTLLLGDMPVGPGETETLDCEDVNDYADSYLVENLPVGSYTLVKTLSINNAAVDIYANLYATKVKELEISDCFTTYETFVEEATAELSEGYCEIDCDYCTTLDEMDVEEFIDAYKSVDPLEEPSAEEAAALTDLYNSVVADCGTLCSQPANDFCDMGYQMMLEDMRPGGQYAEYIDPATGEINPSLYYLSILNVENIFPVMDFGLGGVFPYRWWKTPYRIIDGIWTKGYFNEDGTERTVIYTTTIGGDIIPNATKYYTDEFEKMYVLPEELIDVKTFIAYYLANPSWAHSLVGYHPEWFYYQNCSTLYENTVAIEAVDYNTYQYDAYLLQNAYEDETFDDLIHPEGAASLTDPFFDIATGFSASAMTDRLNEFINCDDPITAYQFAYLTTYVGAEVYDWDCDDLHNYIDGTLITEDKDFIDSYETWLAFVGIYTGLKHDMWQDAADADADITKSYNGCIGAKPYNYDFSYTDDIVTEIVDFEGLIEDGYICGLPTGFLLSGKIPRFGSPSNIFGLAEDAGEDEIYAEIDGTYADGDLSYFDNTGNPANARDLEYFLYGWVVDETLTTLSPISVTNNPQLTHRFWMDLDDCGITTWNPAIVSDDLVWDPDGVGGLGTQILLDDPAGFDFGVDEIIDLYDIKITGPTSFQIEATVDDGVSISYNNLITGTTGSCIHIDDYYFINSSCDLTSEATALLTMMNIELAELGEFESGSPADIEESPVFSLALYPYLGEATFSDPYTWEEIDDDEYKLSNAGGDRYLSIHFNTDLIVGDDISSLTGESLPDYVGPNNNFKLIMQPGDVEYTGYIEWHWDVAEYDFPVTDCGFEPPISCSEPEHYNNNDLQGLLQKLVTDGKLVPSTPYSIDPLTEYTDRLELITGSPTTPEYWRMIENDDTHYKAAISSYIDDEYVDNCYVEFTMYDPEVIGEFEFDDTEITSLDHITPDYSGSPSQDYTYDFTATFVAGLDEYEIQASACIPIKSCSECTELAPGDNGDYAFVKIWLGSTMHATEVYAYTNDNTESVFPSLGVTTGVTTAHITIISEAGETYIETSYPVNGITANILGYYDADIIASVTPTVSVPDIFVIIELGTGIGATPDITVPLDEACLSNTIHLPEFESINRCFTNLLAVCTSNAQAAYESYLETLREDFIANYKAQCFSSLEGFAETFTMEYDASEYQYTLYYYDQAGNLVATVPPEGVKVLPDSELDDVATARAGGTTYTFADPHELASYYVYNTLNELKWQKTPDAGISEFWYDRLGRLVLSQNAEQNIPFEIDDPTDYSKYSYSKYDALGRVNEVGQVTTVDLIEEDVDFETFVNDMENFPDNLSYVDRVEVTHTFYDAAPSLPETPPFGADGQENLRKRIATVLYQDEYDDTWVDYQHATHYTYDIHGNVFTLIQDNPSLEPLDEQFKKIDYLYDLLSGNVHKVSYQAGDEDQFFHKYLYDADNRIEEVYTSHNGYYWTKEAVYDYYRHGPLARIEIGELKVQGIDYAYTINGWLKGVNAGALNTTRDMGRDGRISGGNPHQYTAQDASGFVLHYFDGDYTRIDNTANDFVPAYSGSDFYAASPDLFNGNIKAMITALRENNGDVAPALGKAYTYDQLNRLTSSHSFEAANIHETGMFSWAGRSEDDEWATEYTYDGNGNIMTMKRAGDGGSAFDMDDLEYIYYPNSNQLKYVADAVSSGTYSTDIDDQSSVDTETTIDPADNVYSYDLIGNLIRDDAEGIDEITWTIYGKIRTIDKSSGPDLEFAYDATGNRIMKKVTPASGPTIYTYYARDAQGNVMATYTRKELTGGGAYDSLYCSEQHIYGSNRLGYRQILIDMAGSLTLNNYFSRTLGEKRYEMTNHLGNVLAVITDRHKGVETTSDDFSDTYLPDVVASQDYDPFGMIMEGRQWVTTTSYRYGFNGKEQDTETYGEGNIYDYGFRIYNPRLGKFLSVDPLFMSYPELTTYQFASNTPIQAIDLDGLEKYHYTRTYDDQGTTKLTLINVEKVYKKVITTYIYAPNSQNGRYPIYETVEDETKQYIVHDKLVFPIAGKTSNKYQEYDCTATFNSYGSAQNVKDEDFIPPFAYFLQVGIEAAADASRDGQAPGSVRSAYISRTSTTPQTDRIGTFNYSIKNGRVTFKNNMSTKGLFDVVIDAEGRVLIGDGHYKMTGGAKKVIAAGTIKINENGQITQYSNSSGHYSSGASGLDNLKSALKNASLINDETIGIDVGKE